MLTVYFDEPVELTEALEEEREVIAEESLNRTWTEVREILHGAAKQPFFDRVTEKLPSTLQGYATQSALRSRAVSDFHMKYENLDRFLISLNYYLGQQTDLDNFRYANLYLEEFFDLPQTAPERSALYNILTNLIKS
jgi:hypothetical protein